MQKKNKQNTMEVRDLIALAAMYAIIAGRATPKVFSEHKNLANLSYEVADAMLKKKGK